MLLWNFVHVRKVCTNRLTQTIADFIFVGAGWETIVKNFMGQTMRDSMNPVVRVIYLNALVCSTSVNIYTSACWAPDCYVLQRSNIYYLLGDRQLPGDFVAWSKPLLHPFFYVAGQEDGLFKTLTAGDPYP